MIPDIFYDYSYICGQKSQVVNNCIKKTAIHLSMKEDITNVLIEKKNYFENFFNNKSTSLINFTLPTKTSLPKSQTGSSLKKTFNIVPKNQITIDINMPSIFYHQKIP